MNNPILVAVINQSTLVNDNAVSNVVAHLQTQIKYHFTPAWGIAADVWFYPKSISVPATAWQLIVLDNSDQAGALGYHDITATGLPLAKIFVKDTVSAGFSWSVTMSHELLEMLVDPEVNLTVFNQNTNTTGVLYAYELCDAVEDDSFGYAIGSVKVSDFILPHYFVAGSPRPYDFKEHIQEPFQLLPGGYASVFDVTGGSGWTQLNGRTTSNLNRTILRQKPRSQWQKSEL